jgi:microcystin-dependent protein
MSCSNCYNGCPQIISDQCVKYTGIDIPVLGIKKGDSLSYVEQAIITFLTSTLDGTGIKPNIDEAIICQIVSKNLPTCGDLTVVDFLKALIQAVCELKTLVDGIAPNVEEINDFIASLEAAYNINDDCLTIITPDLTSTSGTHAILQAVIDRLCNFIAIEAPGTYVRSDTIDEIIQSYLAGLPGASKYYTKMIPFVAVPFFPTPAIQAKFNANGAGQDEWEKVYYCNGQSVGGYQTPDFRGRVPVGVTTGMGGGTLSPIVSPGGLNPDYQLGTNTGANGITLSVPQLPSHTHVITNVIGVDVNDPEHSHTLNGANASWNGSSTDGKLITPDNRSGVSVSNPSSTGITVDVTVNSTASLTGGNEAHSNVQPGIGCYYIMYIP